MTELVRDPREGILEQVEGRWRLRFERVLGHPPEKVWRALTEESHLAAWFPTTIEGELRTGAPLQFRFREDEAEPTTGEVIVCQAPRVLEFTWGFTGEGDERPEQCRFELAPEGDGCRLTFLTTYDQVGKSARDAAGWHVCFDLLEAHLAGEPPAEHGPERWKPLNRRYAERFGPEASTIGPPASHEAYQSTAEDTSPDPEAAVEPVEGPAARTGMLIRRPAAEVFEAFVDPEVTTKFWFTKSTGRLEVGRRVQWAWEMYGVSVPVDVKVVEPNRRILIEWPEEAGTTTVEWRFTPLADGTTYVQIVHSGFAAESADLVNQVADSAQGFSFVLAGLKALLEHGVRLNLVADRAPVGVQA